MSHTMNDAPSAGSNTTLYFCPGERHPISRAVHLSRLAAFYPKCRECPLRNDTGQLSRQTIARLQKTEHRVRRSSLMSEEGLRGVYLNEVTRQTAGQAATALAGMLWERSPLVARGVAGERRSETPGQSRLRPTVVAGYDERPSSPDLFTGVTLALRRMGCQVIDIGLTTHPQFRFAIDHLQATAGILVTGAGWASSWTGLDFVGPQVTPLSRIDAPHAHPSLLTLNELERRMQLPASRFTRQSGPQRAFQVHVPYEAGLWKHFHALRPLSVCVGTPGRLIANTLRRLFERLPCHLRLLELPDRQRDLGESADADLQRLSAAVRQSHSHLGLIIDHDGQQTAFVDERGQPVGPGVISRLILQRECCETPQVTVVLDALTDAALQATARQGAARRVDGGNRQATVYAAMLEHNAQLGCGGTHRIWLRDTFVTCDAVLTLARILSVLSRSDAAFSEVAAPAG